MHASSPLPPVRSACSTASKNRKNNFPLFSSPPPPPCHPHSFALAAFYVLFGFAVKTPGETLQPVCILFDKKYKFCLFVCACARACVCVWVHVRMCELACAHGVRVCVGGDQTQQNRNMRDRRRGETVRSKWYPTVYSCNFGSFLLWVWLWIERFIVKESKNNGDRKKETQHQRQNLLAN